MDLGEVPETPSAEWLDEKEAQLGLSDADSDSAASAEESSEEASDSDSEVENQDTSDESSDGQNDAPNGGNRRRSRAAVNGMCLSPVRVN